MSGESLRFLVNLTVHPSTVNSVIKHVWEMGFAGYLTVTFTETQYKVKQHFFVSAPVWERFYITQQFDG
jgi:hypothetical protein